LLGITGQARVGGVTVVTEGCLRLFGAGLLVAIVVGILAALT